MDWPRSRWDWIVRNKFLTCIIVFAVGLLVFGVVMVCRHWGWIVTESGSTIIRNLGLVIGGLIAIGFGIWRGVVADRQAKASQEQAKASLHQAETSQRGLLNERYQKGAEMLGSKVLAVRLGGIYALHRLAKAKPEQYHILIMDLFCAFVRHPTKDEDDKIMLGGIREDVQAALKAISDRTGSEVGLEKKADFLLNLIDADLRSSVLIRANLTRVFLGCANLTGANLTRAFLIGANLIEVNLTDAKLTGAILVGVKGLTQDQLDQACADPDNPPKLDGVQDAKTGKPLKWRGKRCKK